MLYSKFPFGCWTELQLPFSPARTLAATSTVSKPTCDHKARQSPNQVFSHLQAPMVRIPGKMFPVALEYVPVGGGRGGPMSARADKTDAYVGRRGLRSFSLVQLAPIKARHGMCALCRNASVCVDLEQIICFPNLAETAETELRSHGLLSTIHPVLPPTQ